MRGAKEGILHTDCRALVGLFKKELCEIRNPRLQNMMEDIKGIVISPRKVEGKRHAVADYLSRLKHDETNAPEYEDFWQLGGWISGIPC